MTSIASSPADVAAPPFTLAQWEELERQALIYKHFAAGVPVPHELLLPLRCAAAAVASAPFFYHPTLGYLSCYGKKLDPEPGRCRRTDGKKWRCSKDAHPDSKYCERHMHRSRNRSRKPVEKKTVSQTQSCTSTVRSCIPSGITGAGSGTGSISTINQQYSIGSSHSHCPGSAAFSASQWNTSLRTCGLGSREYRPIQGVKAEADQHSFLSGASASTKAMAADSTLSNSWRLLPSEVRSFSVSHPSMSYSSQANYQHGLYSHDLEQPPSSFLKQQHSILGRDFDSQGKHENESVRPFLDEWPRTRDLWSDMEQDRSNNRISFSTTQLSISVPTAANYSPASSTPKDEASLLLGIDH